MEYCSTVFHTMITAADSNELERIQMQALKGIYGWRYSYRELLERSGVSRLDVRRDEKFMSMTDKMINNVRFACWFPLRLYRGNIRPRGSEKYKIYHSHTERYLNSPLNVMRRKLNKMYV